MGADQAGFLFDDDQLWEQGTGTISDLIETLARSEAIVGHCPLTLGELQTRAKAVGARHEPAQDDLDLVYELGTAAMKHDPVALLLALPEDVEWVEYDTLFELADLALECCVPGQATEIVGAIAEIIEDRENEDWHVPLQARLGRALGLSGRIRWPFYNPKRLRELGAVDGVTIAVEALKARSEVDPESKNKRALCSWLDKVWLCISLNSRDSRIDSVSSDFRRFVSTVAELYPDGFSREVQVVVDDFWGRWVDRAVAAVDERDELTRAEKAREYRAIARVALDALDGGLAGTVEVDHLLSAPAP